MEQRVVVKPNGREAAYLASGKDASVVLIPGGSLASQDWLPVAEHLQGRPWVAIDLPGHGRSDHENLYSFERDADAVVSLLELGGRPAVLVGHSRGGLVAAIVASRRPDLVLGVCYEDVTPLFVDSPLRKTHVVPKSVNGLGDLVRQLRSDGRTVDWLAAQISTRLHDEQRTFSEVLPPSAIASWAEQLLHADVDMFGPKVERVGTKLTPTEQLATFTGPVHLVHGELPLGSIVPPGELEEMRSYAPQTTSTELAGTGHFLHAQTPDRFAADLCRFLGALGV